jgi:hypothetical protein
MLAYLTSETAEQAKEHPTESASESQRRALVQLCRVIFNLNEFVYVK